TGNHLRPLLELQVDDARVPLSGNVTLGRHLDNDLIIAGEDVLDYHARITLSARAVTLAPLLDATVTVNEQTCDKAIGIVPGDTIQIGASAVSVLLQGESTHTEHGWHLHSTSGPDAIRLQSSQLIGRDEDADLQIADDHISRAHARLTLDRYVWLADLGSANGTFVNGERIIGGVRLFHGDYVSFDTFRYQLIGSAPDLTPVRLESELEPAPLDTVEPPEIRSDTTVIGAVDLDAPVLNASGIDAASSLSDIGGGAFFIGASDPISGEIFRPGIGRNLIGRGTGCDLVIAHQTVSLEHAEVIARAEGCTVTNLMATNGTRVNGASIQTAPLADGDVLRLGQISLVYKDVPITGSDQRLLRRLGIGLLLASIAVAAALLMLLD
ncbi:MAG: FHA domain-containing protein, partial [Pseudomonadales bacterium]